MFSGHSITIDLNGSKFGKMKFYSISFSKNKFEPEDPFADCENYPTSEDETFLECDDKFLERSFSSKGLPIPVWLKTSKNITMTNKYVEDHDLNLLSMSNLISGVDLSPCSKPCVSTKVTSRLVQDVISYDGTSWIDIVPAPKVLVTETKFVRPSMTELMSELGGALGLWLGIGMLQVVHMALNQVVRLYHDRNYIRVSNLFNV